MSLPDAPASLPPELQHTLQQAVQEANNATYLSTHKSSKRARAEEGTDGVEGERIAKKKKSKKRDEHASGEPATSQPNAPVALDALPADSSTTDRPKPKKKKSKGKEKAANPAPDPPPAPAPAGAPPIDIGTSSADFLSAVVAAASAISGPQPDAGNDALRPYEYAPPPDFAPYAYAPAPGFDPQAGAFPDLLDLNYATSEDLLRTLQDFDITKVVSVLKTLGEAAAAANVSLGGQQQQQQQLAGPSGVQVKPVRSEAILGHPPKQKKTGAQVGTARAAAPTPPPLQHDNADHAHMLANVWMNAAKLAEMVKKEGLVYKKGKFSAIEDAHLDAAIERYRTARGISEEELDALIFSREKGRDSFWSEITSALHLRPIIAVYHHVRRSRHPMKKQGTWMPAEDENLMSAYTELGPQWEKISAIVGRTSSDCRDRYRNHIHGREVRNSGSWSKEEEEELVKIVTELTVDKGKDVDNDIFWGIVSDRMGGKRGRQQCRIKWTDSLAPQLKNVGERPRWSQMDAYILVHKVDSMNVRDDTEIDWKLLPDEHWNIWSAHSLQRRWLTMKRGIKGFEDMSHAEIMEILKTKKAHSPPPSSSGRKKKSKYRSADAIDDIDDGSEEAGPSNGIGIIV